MKFPSEIDRMLFIFSCYETWWHSESVPRGTTPSVQKVNAIHDCCYPLSL